MINPKGMREHIEEEIAGEDYSGILRDIERSRRERYTAKRKPKIINWKINSEEDPDSFGFKPPEGSIMFFWARKENDLLRKLESAYISHDTRRLDRLYHNRFESDLSKRSLLSLEEAKEEFIESDTFFDLRYDGKVLAESLWESTEEKFGLVILPFSGGRINGNEFTIVEHFLDQDSKDCSPYQVLIVVCQPILSDIEKRALEAVPPEMDEIKIGRLGPVVQILPGMVAGVVAATVIGTLCVADFDEELEQLELSPELVDELGSTAAVERLVEMRSEIFEEYETVR